MSSLPCQSTIVLSMLMASMAIAPPAYAEGMPTGAEVSRRQLAMLSPADDSDPASRETELSTSGKEFRWMPALFWGEMGGWVGGVLGIGAGEILWGAAGKRDGIDQLSAMLDAAVWGMYGFACAWPFGVAAGTYFYGTRIHGNGSFMAALAGSLLATASIVGLGHLAQGSRQGTEMAVLGGLLLPPVASALGYYWTSSSARGQPEVSLSLVQYDAISGLRLGMPAVRVSESNGVRSIGVSLFAGRL